MTAAAYVHTVRCSVLDLLRTLQDTQQRRHATAAAVGALAPSPLCASALRADDLGLHPLLAWCFDLGARPAALLERAQATAPPALRPMWTDPQAMLGDADQGRLSIAAGPGDMAALAASTVTLLQMIRTAQQRELADVAGLCRITPAVLASVESGEQDPDLGVVLALCWHLRVRPPTLMMMAESRTFASGTRRPVWTNVDRLLASTRQLGLTDRHLSPTQVETSSGSTR